MLRLALKLGLIGPLVLGMALNPLMAWDVIGHRVVGEVAQRHLRPLVLEEVKSLLDGQELAYISTWADEIKSQKAWDQAKKWHYINIPAGQSLKSARRSAGGDVVEAIKRFERTLKDRKKKKAERAEALKFLVHLVGDVHQPLHTGYEEDHGGNDVELYWFQEKSNLHRVWDEHLVDFQKFSFTELTRLIDRASSQEISIWQARPLEVWVEESRQLLPQVYDVRGGKLSYDYFNKNVATVNTRLLQAGIRLAGLLNGALESSGTQGSRTNARETISPSRKK